MGMKKAIPALLLTLAALCCAQNAAADWYPGTSGSTTGVGDDTVNQSLAEEFAKCSVFNDIAARCAKKAARAGHEKLAANHEDLAKRFYKGGYMLSGQDFTQKRIRLHDAAMRRSAGNACEDFPKLDQQYRKRCDDTYKRLPRPLR